MFKYVNMQLKTKLEYKSSFILSIVAQIISFAMFYLVLYSKFAKFGMLKEYTFNEVLLSFSIINFGFSIAEFLFRGFDHFGNLIKKGSFDILLLRPENIYLQIIGSDISFEKIARAFNSLIVFIYALIISNISLNISNILILLLILLGSIIIFASIFILGATLCFFTIEGLEIVNIFTDGSRQLGQYPIGIFGKTILAFFTFVLPVACINYYPFLYLLNKSDNILYGLSPIFSILFILPSIVIFNLGLKKYQSSGT